jgi:hypothetical protein
MPDCHFGAREPIERMQDHEAGAIGLERRLGADQGFGAQPPRNLTGQADPDLNTGAGGAIMRVIADRETVRRFPDLKRGDHGRGRAPARCAHQKHDRAQNLDPVPADPSQGAIIE